MNNLQYYVGVSFVLGNLFIAKGFKFRKKKSFSALQGLT